jgi:hypothetical protein
MASKTLLDELELPLAQCIDVEDSQALVRHAVPGLDGDLLQRMGRRAARVAVTGVVTGPEARDGLEQLRDKLRQTEPVDFVADIATATRVSRVLVEELDVRELAGKPERFEYAFLLREFNPPPGPETLPPDEVEVENEPDPETGTLEVEVIVEGEPDFDMGRVTVTAEGPLGTPSSSVHPLPDREGNLWTLGDLAEGSYTVRGTVAQPVMAGTETAAIQIGKTTRVQLRLLRAAGVARAFTLSFRFNSAFVEPCMRAVLRRAAEYSDAHPSENLVVVGHTDKVDDEPYNQSLSERRARTVFSSLDFAANPQRAVDEWTAIRQEREVRHRTEKDTWEIREYQQMLQELGYYPGRIDAIHGPITNEAVRAFRCDHALPPGITVDEKVWKALISRYLGDDAPVVPRDRFLPNCAGTIVEWLGCGEEDPVLPVDRAHRPNRRTELLFVTDAALPCPVRVPDTWHLPAATGRTPAQWCVGKPDSSRTCFISRDTPAPPAWMVEHADSAQISVTVRIQREVEQPDGTTLLAPGGVTRFVLITGEGAFKQDELGSGEPREAVTGADGTFVVPEPHRAGVFVLEVREGVLARLEEEADASSTGPGVCKTLLADGEISVVILRDPVLREIRLAVIAHLMTALHPDTREVRTCPDPADPAAPRPQRTSADEAAVEALLARVNQVWRRGRVRFELDHVVRETFATAGVTECHVLPDEADQVVAEATTPNFTNLFLFGSIETTGDAGRTVASQVVDATDGPLFEVNAVTVGDRVAVHPSAGAPAVERAPDADEQGVILAHHLGHYLELQDATSASRRQLMFTPESTSNRRLLAGEVDQARAAHNARGNCARIFMTVQGAERFGGARGHRFVAMRDAAAPPVVVDALLPQGVTPGPAFAMRGGVQGAAPTQRLVARAVAGRIKVVARLAQSGGARAIESWAFVYVVNFTVEVDGAVRLGDDGLTSRFLAVRAPGQPLVARAVLAPVIDPVPDDLATWQVVTGTAEEVPDPLRRRVPREVAGGVELRVTVGGVTRTIRITVAELALEVPNGVRLGPVGSGRFLVTVDPVLTATIRAVFTPPVAEPVPPGLVTWGGDPTGEVSPLERRLSRTTARTATVTATVGGVTRSVAVEVSAFTLRVEDAAQADPPAGTVFFASRDTTPGSVVTVVAELAPPPSQPLPPDAVAWSVPGADPLRRTVSRAAAGSTDVSATLTDTTRTVTIVVVGVTLGAAPLVGRGLEADVAVTLDPSPLPAGRTVTLRLATVAGTGEALFAATGTGTLQAGASGAVRLRGVTESSAAGNIRLRAALPGGVADVAETPVTVVAAAIAAIPALRVNVPADVVVTVTPTPLPPGTSLTLEIVADPGTAGAAVFDDTGTATRTITGTTPVRLRGTAASGTPDNLRLVVRITGQAGVLAERRFTVRNRLSVFLAFEIFNLGTGAFDRLPAGVGVELVDEDTVIDDVLATRQTDAQGRVTFSLPDFSGSGEDEPDLFFRVRGGGRAASGHTLPDEWSTKGWRAVDGSPGFFPDFTGETIGSEAAPLVFRVGVDFHVRVLYEDRSLFPAADRPAPIGVPVSVFRDAVVNARLSTRRTNVVGEVHGVTFDVSGGDTLFLRVEFEIEDAAINLRRGRVSLGDWDTDLGAVDRTSVGTQAAPRVLHTAGDDRHVALFMLKHLRELSTFLFHMTSGTWPGFQDELTFFRTSISGTAYSWPVGAVNIPPSDHFNRDTIIHEMTHQVFWQELNVSTVDIAVEAAFGGLILNHFDAMHSNTEHAIIEGFPEFLAAVFTATADPAHNIVNIAEPDFSNPRPLGPPPPDNRGERVEGAFANGVFALFWRHVLGHPVFPGGPLVAPSVNGDITAATPFLADPAARARFMSMIWLPLRDLRPNSDKRTTDMIARILARNPAQAPALRAELQRFNLAFP